MGITKRRQVKFKQQEKRKIKRLKLKKKGIDPDKVYVGAVNLGLPK